MTDDYAQQLLAILESISESLRILVLAVEDVAERQAADEEI